MRDKFQVWIQLGEALLKWVKEGLKEVYVQPLHIIYGERIW